MWPQQTYICDRLLVLHTGKNLAPTKFASANIHPQQHIVRNRISSTSGFTSTVWMCACHFCGVWAHRSGICVFATMVGLKRSATTFTSTSTNTVSKVWLNLSCATRSVAFQSRISTNHLWTSKRSKCMTVIWAHKFHCFRDGFQMFVRWNWWLRTLDGSPRSPCLLSIWKMSPLKFGMVNGASKHQ